MSQSVILTMLMNDLLYMVSIKGYVAYDWAAVIQVPLLTLACIECTARTIFDTLG